MKENDGGDEFNYDIFDIKTVVNATQRNNKINKLKKNEKAHQKNRWKRAGPCFHSTGESHLCLISWHNLQPAFGTTNPKQPLGLSVTEKGPNSMIFLLIY
jgi:hypothetical protein